MNLREAIRRVVIEHQRNGRILPSGHSNPDYEGMNASQVLSELRERKEELGLSPERLRSVTLSDVWAELQDLSRR